jgi:hypothetical protein
MHRGGQKQDRRRAVGQRASPYGFGFYRVSGEALYPKRDLIILQKNMTGLSVCPPAWI